MFEHVVDTLPEVNKPLSAKYSKSFGYPTFKKRIPSILQEIINNMKQENDVGNSIDKADLEEVIKKISDLIKSMLSNQPFAKMIANGKLLSYEVKVYNEMINEKQKENNGKLPTWFQTDWLFAECYLYFKLHEIFYVSKTMQKYDPFLNVKTGSLLESKNAILLLSDSFAELKKENISSEAQKKEKFIIQLKYSLWGNRADLSLSCGKSVAASEETFTNIGELDQYILANDVEAAYDILNSDNENEVIDIVLDNAGYELFSDLCFADFLLWSGLAKKIIFHGKTIPWFVSDVTADDFNSVFELLKTNMKSDAVASLVETWKNYVKNGQWQIKYESFWILPYDYSKMRTEAPELYADLSKNKMVIFKGDLNYRKLMGDIYWEPTTSFKTALRGFAPTNILALRTIKADTISGLKKGIFEDLSYKDPGWLITGKYGLIQLLKR